jgi:hypothetical protein
MAIDAGLLGIVIGCLYTKAEKCSKICGCFVSISIENALREVNSGNFEGLLKNFLRVNSKENSESKFRFTL